MCVQNLKIGDWVWLADKVDSRVLVASGQVSGLGNGGMFHNRPIPNQFARVNIDRVDVNMPLYVPVEEADQTFLKDAEGSSVLWPQSLTYRKT